MLDAAILVSQAGATALIAGWLSLGVRDNILYPSVNETYTAEVMEMARLKREYPDAYAQIAHRAITSRRTQRMAFRLVVFVETIACLLLWAGAIGLLMAAAGYVVEETARTLALCGALVFTIVWAGFLIIGNHFCYWFCHEGAQNTHYQMTLWGLGTMIFLTAGS